MNKISAVYKIVNTVTKDYYVGSSKDAKRRWQQHKRPSAWKNQPNNPLYLNMQKYGVDKFRLQILAPVMPEYLKQVEQEFIDLIQPTYNNNRADGLDMERRKKHQKEYQQSEKYKEAQKKYWQSEEGKERNRKRAHKNMKKYHNQLCSYNGETLTLNALALRFHKAGIEHPNIEARKYLIERAE